MTSFEETQTRTGKKALVSVRQDQHRFKFRVLGRYGARCAVCDVAVEKLLDAAHLRTHSERGSDDPRNGLVLCALHHRAYDAGLLGIDPSSLAITYRGASAAELRVTRASIGHLDRLPHKSALEWRWKRWSAGASAASPQT